MAREYHQFCGLAHALEILGGRWTLLVVRDLLGGPMRFTDLQAGLPGIASNMLSDRLRELEEAGVVRRRLQPRPASGVVYELTEYGLELEDALVRLGLWGLRSMGPMQEGAFFSVNALALGLRGAFDREKGKGVSGSYALTLDGQQLRVVVADGKVSFPADQTVRPNVSIEGGVQAFYGLFSGQTKIDEASRAGQVKVIGSLTAARRFFEMFRLGGPVEPVSAETR